ncbi:hypothetical protein T265_10710 [Opisthorchis viverrini]|uniref:Uncharacterized protein n=1 Tax=Opisthorchis viverrini TaxID=6198 RepID=A0A074Z5M8_OPIVI|nr:hypothetical protein T265_10710 [Opisthorchis viverrini]KER20837.1 hypothetical protein T265_10710 [Opisthorchis viverrini]
MTQVHKSCSEHPNPDENIISRETIGADTAAQLYTCIDFVTGVCSALSTTIISPSKTSCPINSPKQRYRSVKMFGDNTFNLRVGCE